MFDARRRLDLKDNAFRRRAPSAGLDETLRSTARPQARKAIVEHLEALGLLDKIEPTTHTVPHGDRSGVGDRAVPDRPVVCRTPRRLARAGDRRGARRARPRSCRRTGRRPIFDWMENIQPWCISRQLWWGHQIPAWYGPDGKVFVAETEDEAVADALAHYTEIGEITRRGARRSPRSGACARFANDSHRDEDVLDTWFSSALWPFSTLGWPDETPELQALLPDHRAGHRLRHHLLLGRAHDDDGPALHGGSAVPHRLHPRAGARRERRTRCRSRRATSSTRST